MGSPRSTSLIIDIYGGFIRRLGGWIAVADLIVLMGSLGVDEQAVRSAVSRMSRKGMLVRIRRGGRIGYILSDEARDVLADGDLRIFASREPAALQDGWILAVFSVPEPQRGHRHQLRSQLAWLGFGSLGGGVWLAPRRVAAQAREAVGKLGLTGYVELFEAHYAGFGEPASLVRRCWDVDGLAVRYAEFVAEAQPVADRWRNGPSASDEQAFVDYVAVVHGWRKMPYLDPGLPPEVLPSGWQGQRAQELFSEVMERVDKRAARHVEHVMGS